MAKFKVQEQEIKADVKAAEPTNAALAIFNGNMLANPCATMVEEAAEFLPTFKLPFSVEGLSLPVCDSNGQPLMRDGQPVMESATGRFVLTSGGKLTPIPAPHTITAYCIRGATRETVEKNGKKSYIRTLTRLGSGADGKSLPVSEKHAAQVARGKKGGVDVGNISLVVVMYKDQQTQQDTAVVGLIESFKTLGNYFVDPLLNGLLRDKRGITISITDHKQNQTKSANDYYYFDARKFTQWKSTQLTEEQLALAIGALKNKAESVDGWLKREE